MTKRKFKGLAVALIFASLLVSCGESASSDVISGRVLDESGPVVGATVRIKAAENSVTTDAGGQFFLTGLKPEGMVYVTAWAAGYYIGGAEASPGDDELEIHLHAHTDEDNPDYAWLPSLYHPGQGEDQGCAGCHSMVGSDVDFPLPVDEWLLDAHAGAATNPRFLTMYSGSDVDGNQSPLTRYGYNRDYGSFPIRPDPNQPYYGPGYKLDFPETAGNCAACHTPLAAVNGAYSADPTYLTDIEIEGISCDFCHKIWDIRLDPVTNMPYPNMPGVLSLEFRRPPEGHQFFAGPLDDVAPGEDTYSPIQRESQFCAPCHFGVFWDTIIYNSYGEWLESPYSNPETGSTCQDCHMPPIGVTHFALPEEGGTARDPETIFSHHMPGASDLELLRNAVSMTVDLAVEGDQLIVDVEIINDQTGHHVPTDSPLRQMILLVQARDSGRAALQQITGPTVPAWGGVGDPEDGYYAGVPGKGYAKILMELWTEISPSGAYWNPTRILSDNRLAAFEVDKSSYTFEMPDNGKPTVTVRLLFRRAFIELAVQKGWDVKDIVMEEVIVQVR